MNRHYAIDSFEMVFDWRCELAGNKHIGYEEYPDPDPEIPEWCPLRSNK